MFNLLSKGCFLISLAFLYVINFSLAGWGNHGVSSSRLYIGGFGGGIFSNSTQLSQMGTAFFPEAAGGPLAVFAQGDVETDMKGFGGAQIGYERVQFCGCSNWTLGSAVELEAFFYRNHRNGHLTNPTDRLPEHDFEDSFCANMSTLLVNALFSLNTPRWCGFSPYIGGGLGATRLSIHHATSFQIAPPEQGINHFNSRTNDSSWTFTAQIKAGIRYNICKSFHIFGEYRFLYLDSSNYILGSTVYPTHAPTSPWNLKLEDTHYNALVLGIQYDL